jgi:hypothetical protein
MVVYLATLPVELDASFGKALATLEQGGCLARTDLPAARCLAARTSAAGRLAQIEAINYRVAAPFVPLSVSFCIPALVWAM